MKTARKRGNPAHPTAKKLKKRPFTRRKQAPGRADRTGLSLMQLFAMFPDEAAARQWFEDVRWGADGRVCGRCGSADTHGVPNEKPMPYRCRACRRYFSVRTGTVMESSRLPLRKWVLALYLMSTNLKGVSSMKLHRDLAIAQSTAWYLVHRIRMAWADYAADRFAGPVEVDETYIGGMERNKHRAKKLKAGRGPVGKTAVVGMKDRVSKQVHAQPVDRTDKATLQRFVTEHIAPGAAIYTDDHRGYSGLHNHESVMHSVREYVRDQVHTNGIESFWAMLKRGYIGTYHRMSPQHLHRYVTEFAGRQNVRSLDTSEQMTMLAIGMVGKRLRYRDLTARS